MTLRLTNSPWLLACFVALGLVGCQGPADLRVAEDPADQPVLIAASNMVHPPFSSWEESGKAVGIEVDLVEGAAAILGCRVEWVERPFPELLPALEKREIDFAVSTIGITDERARRVAFSDSYFETEIVALVRNDESAPVTLDDLNDKRIGADQSTTSFSAAKKRWSAGQLVGAAQDGSSWSRMVQDGVIAAFVVDASDQERLQDVSGIELRRIREPLSAEYFAVAMQKGAPEKVAAVNRMIADYLRRVRAHESSSN